MREKTKYDVLENCPELVKSIRQLEYQYSDKKDMLYDCLRCEDGKTFDDILHRTYGFIDHRIWMLRWTYKCELRCLAIGYSQCLYARLKRVKSRVQSMLESGSDCYFLTFNINDSSVVNTSDWLCRVIKSTLSEMDNFVANVDFCPTTGRMHFHAVVSCSSQSAYNSLFRDWDDGPNRSRSVYGWCDVEPIVVPNNEALSKYVDKLALHGVKDSARRMMFSRTKRTASNLCAK